MRQRIYQLGSNNYSGCRSSYSTSCLIILDDRLARKYASECGLNFIGTVRLLDIAEQKGLIEDAAATIDEISSNGYRISSEILKMIRTSN